MAKRATRKPTRTARPAHPKPDPIYAAIAKKKATMAAFTRANDATNAFEANGIESGSRYREAWKRWEKACHTDQRTTILLCKTVPTTLAGLVALGTYAAEINADEIEGQSSDISAVLLRTIVKAAKNLGKEARR